MLPEYIESGQYTGRGIYSLGGKYAMSLSIRCMINITLIPGFATLETIYPPTCDLSGYYQLDSAGKKHKFTALIHQLSSQQRTAVTEFSDSTFRRINGVLAESKAGVLVLGRSDDETVQISQYWNESVSKNGFSISGIVLVNNKPPITYSVSFEMIDPEGIRSNVIRLDNSA